jgi:hypothetical protein
MTDSTSRPGGRRNWAVLAVAAILAILALLFFLNKDGAGQAPVLENTTARSAVGKADPDGDRAERAAAAETGAALDGAGGELVAGARNAAGAVGEVTEGAAGAAAEGARDAARTAEIAVERSTDGDPDSDRNERR